MDGSVILLPLDASIDAYAACHPRLAAGLRFVRETDLLALPLGKNPVPGFALEDLFVGVDQYDTRLPAAQVWESHRVYGDIQVVAQGAERVGWVPTAAKPPVKTEYLPERDVMFYEVPEKSGLRADYFELAPGRAAVFFPHDIHAPCLMIGQPQPVRKIVVKFRL